MEGVTPPPTKTPRGMRRMGLAGMPGFILLSFRFFPILPGQLSARLEVQWTWRRQGARKRPGFCVLAGCSCPHVSPHILTLHAALRANRSLTLCLFTLYLIFTRSRYSLLVSPTQHSIGRSRPDVHITPTLICLLTIAVLSRPGLVYPPQ